MNLYDFTAADYRGNPVSLESFQGKVVLIVNTATKCGLTPQYEALQQLYDRYHDRGLEILDFPCNQFLEQAPENDGEINDFCTLNYQTAFPRFAKIEVNGKNAHPLFRWLKEQQPEDRGGEAAAAFEEKVKQFTPGSVPGDIKWNFGKFLIDCQGNVASRFSPAYPPEKLSEEIESLLEKSAEEELTKAFQIMWGKYNEPVRLIHKSFRVVAGNAAYIATGGKIGIKCPTIGTPEMHKGCQAKASLKDNETKISDSVNDGVEWRSYWVPLEGNNDYFIHFTNGLMAYYQKIAGQGSK